MGFFEFLAKHSALTEENLVEPKLGEWIKKYLAFYPAQDQERDLLTTMGKERWYDMDQVLGELETGQTHGR